MNASQIAVLLSLPNVKAFLKTIRQCEGTDGVDGYRMLFGGKLFDSYTAHPNIAVPYPNKSTTSTAAGAYQILYTTWQMCQKAVPGLNNFSPLNQDAAAVFLISNRNAINDVVIGHFEVAIKKCSKEWASLPGSPYGQPEKTLAQVQSFYTAAGGTIV